MNERERDEVLYNYYLMIEQTQSDIAKKPEERSILVAPRYGHILHSIALFFLFCCSHNIEQNKHLATIYAFTNLNNILIVTKNYNYRQRTRKTKR
jgi:hypothetical protein